MPSDGMELERESEGNGGTYTFVNTVQRSAHSLSVLPWHVGDQSRMRLDILFRTVTLGRTTILLTVTKYESLLF